jgi:hypothetical protein
MLLIVEQNLRKGKRRICQRRLLWHRIRWTHSSSTQNNVRISQEEKGETPLGNKLGERNFASPDVKKMCDETLTTIIADAKDKMRSDKKSLKPEQAKELVGYRGSVAKKQDL